MIRRMNVKNILKKRYDIILLIIGIIMFMLINTYKITNASLWYDEGIEYWYSKGGIMPMGIGGWIL